MYKGIKAQSAISNEKSKRLEDIYQSLSEDVFLDFLIKNSEFSTVELENDTKIFRIGFSKDDFNPEISSLLYNNGKKIFDGLSGGNYSHVTERLDVQSTLRSSVSEIKAKFFIIKQICKSMQSHIENDPNFKKSGLTDKMLFSSDDSRNRFIAQKLKQKAMGDKEPEENNVMLA